MEDVIEIFTKGFSIGLLFANISILGGWGIRQLIIFFNNIINGGI